MNRIYSNLAAIQFLFGSRSDIEVFGMFGPGNLGDEAMRITALRNFPRGRAVAWPGRVMQPLQKLQKMKTRRHLIVGGGTLVHGGTTDWLDYVESRVHNGSKLWFFGTGFAFLPEQMSENYQPFARWSALLKKAEGIGLRGPISTRIAQQMGARADIFGDLAISLYPPCQGARRKVDKTIGLNFGHCLADQELFEENSAELLRRLLTRYKPTFYAVVKRDIEPTLRIATKAGMKPCEISLERHYWDPDHFMKKVSRHEAFLGLKLHAAGLSLLAGVPTVMINYLPKCEDFAAPISATNVLANLPIDVDAVEMQVEAAINFGEKWVDKEAISKISEAQKAKMRGFSG